MGVKLFPSCFTEEHILRLLQFRTVKGIFECNKREEVTRMGKNSHNVHLHYFYCVRNGICMNIGNKEWENVARMGKANNYGFLLGKPEGAWSLGKPNVDGRMMLKWISKMQDGRLWAGVIWLQTRT